MVNSGAPAGSTQASGPSSFFVVVQARQPASQRVDGRICLRVVVHEVTQTFSEPAERHLLGATTLRQLFDSAVGEIHERSAVAREHRIHDRGLLGGVRLGLA
jgi:hypothetical protein